jgi:hypothetical protein
LTPGFEQPSTLAEQLRWLNDPGFEATVAWEAADLAVVLATR